MQTDTGRIRKNNEDSCFIYDTSQLDKVSPISYGLYIVADGMGGHRAGEIASQKAVEIIKSTLLDNIEDTLNSDINDKIREAFDIANGEIYNAALVSPLFSGMGTTATLGLRKANTLYIGHVGDSRAYLIHNRKIIQLTRDHSLVESLKDSGIITEEESKSHPDRNIITRALGTSKNIIVDSCKEVTGDDRIILDKDDMLVFCTDGLTNEVSDYEILETVQKSASVSIACQKLIDIANNKTGNDNITVIVVESL